MWTATLLKFDTDNGRVDIEVEYTDGVDTHIRSYNLNQPTKKSIRDLVRNEANRFEAVKTEVIDLPVGLSIDITPDPVTPPPGPTAEELAEKAWFDDWHKLNRLVRLANNGLIEMTDTRIVTLQTSLQAGWLNSYLDRI